MKKWFYENHMVLNPEKCHYLVLGKRSNSDTINLNGAKMASRLMKNYLVSLLIVTLSFDKHIKSGQKQAKS